MERDRHYGARRSLHDFNGKTLFTATDQSLTRPGKVALWTKADSVTRFDKLDIQILP